ncbi:hypothetical protein BV20DRAFT_956960 [Pilatotrama ljubarskyi]|nr:hypothetical protein BV20DRAFT_956960 [Pilatotrama ljubarskyi]
MPRLSGLILYLWLASSISWRGVLSRDAGNTTCASGQLDWYTSVVGETPCATYQRLRQICNGDYRVPAFRTLTPGDNCDDQVSGCCCNSIAWALSMLCMNCQYDTQAGDTGIDAGAGAYGLYTSTCGKPLNQTLPQDIQTAVCNREIKLDRNLYSLFWDDGQCVYTKETMTKDFAVTNNNTFTHCNSTLKASQSPSDTSSLSATATNSAPQNTGGSSPSTTKSTSIAPVIGGAVGGVLGGLALAAIAFFLFRRHRRHQGPKPLDLSKEYAGPASSYTDEPQMGIVTPFTAGSAPSNSGYGGGKPPSEEFMLLPFSQQSPQSPEQYAGKWSSPRSADGNDDRHEDAGPVPALQRSASGRLPPAYRHSWDAEEPPAVPPPEYPPHTGSESGGQSASSGVASTPRSPPRARDVKRPFPS